MQLGMIGLGRMGACMTERLVRADHDVVGYDLDPGAVARAVANGATGAETIEDLLDTLDSPKVLWMMVPAGEPVDTTLDRLVPGLDPGDIIVDGGNSFYKDSMARAEHLARQGIHLLDCGTSGGVWGLTEGFSMMVGGDPDSMKRIRPVFESLAPAPDAGWGWVGPAGSGHFVKMIHNGIEYGMMQAYAEGFAVLRAKAELDLDLAGIGQIWQHGSVVRSWLLKLITGALTENPSMDGIGPFVSDSGEGRWAVGEAIDLDVPTPVIALSLFNRIASRDELGYAERLLAAMRHQFGGHEMKPDVVR